MARPNRAHGNTSQILLQDEQSWGTLSTTETPLGLHPRTDTMGNPVNTIESERVTGTRQRPATERGNDRPGGDINAELQPHGPSPLLWKHFLGGDVTTVAAGDQWKHTIEGSLYAGEGMTVEKHIQFRNGDSEYLRFLGTVVNEISLTMPNEGIVSARYGLISRELTYPATPLDPSPIYPANNGVFNGKQVNAVVTPYGGGGALAAPLRSLDLNLTNNFAAEEYLLDGSRLRADLPEGERVINGNGMMFCTLAAYEDIVKDAFANDTPLAIVVTMTRGDYIWKITLPRVKVRGDAPPKIPGKTPIDLELQFEAEQDDPDIIVEITNDDPDLETTDNT